MKKIKYQISINLYKIAWKTRGKFFFEYRNQNIDYNSSKQLCCSKYLSTQILQAQQLAQLLAQLLVLPVKCLNLIIVSSFVFAAVTFIKNCC